ncbi:uncharacterized protein RJT21DRAFT_133087 [Scheffersomyces amazonensis]|uniref:uncharacterized protein n=1 Tax=Scheffersomyces amazonensis TaxID=1078765 RepID=UPI00315CC6DB
MPCSVLHKFRSFISTPPNTQTCTEYSLRPTKRATSLESLPDDILARIIDHLNQLDVLDLCLVNSRIHKLCMKKLFRVAFIKPLEPRTFVVHRKLNSLNYSQFTIVNPKKCPRKKKFQRLIFYLGPNSPNKNYCHSLKYGYYANIDHFLDPKRAEKIINQRSSRILIINMCDQSTRAGKDYYYKVKSLASTLGVFKRIHLSVRDTSFETIKKFQGIFVGVKCLSMSMFFRPGYIDNCESSLSLFRCENITEFEIETDFPSHGDNFFYNMIKSMPNIKILVIRICVKPTCLHKTIELLSNYRIQKFCLDVIRRQPHINVRQNCDIVKALLKSCGSTLELVRVSLCVRFARIGLSKIDLFCSDESDICEELNEEVRSLVSWVKDTITNYPRLEYFIFYNYQFVIDRKVEPYRWIEINNKEL